MPLYDGRALRVDLALYAGETLDDVVFALVDAQSGAPIDLSGCGARLEVRATPSAEPVLALASADDTLVIDAEAGTVQPVLIAVDSAALPPGTYWFELAITFADGSRHVTHVGVFAVAAATTRDP